MRSYKVLKNQIFQSQNYSIVPIRREDRYLIMKWRNEQIFHLRQNKPLTDEDQDKHFDNVVAKLIDQDQPYQMLFSYLEGNKCIGYGGLEHINWTDKNSEIFFIMDTALEEHVFELHWSIFLKLIEHVAFEELYLHKIFTYAFDLRPRLYTVLMENGFEKEAVLKEHCFVNNKYLDVVIHSKCKNELVLRKADFLDIETTFLWSNDKRVRAFAYNQSEITKENHISWFKAKVESDNCEYYILEVNNKAVGSIRFDIQDNQIGKISYLVDPHFTGEGFGTYLLKSGVDKLSKERPEIKSVYGIVLKENRASISIFKKFGYDISFENNSEIKFEKLLQ